MKNYFIGWLAGIFLVLFAACTAGARGLHCVIQPAAWIFWPTVTMIPVFVRNLVQKVWP